MVFQRFNLFPHLTAIENVMEAPIRVKKTNKKQAEADAEKLLCEVGLAEKLDVYPGATVRRPAAAGRDSPGARHEA